MHELGEKAQILNVEWFKNGFGTGSIEVDASATDVGIVICVVLGHQFRSGSWYFVSI